MIKFQKLETREEAGRKLAGRLAKYTSVRNVVVLAIPQGGLAVGAEIASALGQPLDIMLVRNIVAPGPAGTVVGALTVGGVRMLNHPLIDRLHLEESDVQAVILKESLELARQENFYHGHHPALNVSDRTVILVDDGVTPCGTMIEAIRLLRRQHADRIVVAVPVIHRRSAFDLRLEADEVVTLAEPANNIPASTHFAQYPAITDAEARGLLTRKAKCACA